jgi:hypothetical protein
MKFLVIERTYSGYIIRDSINEKRVAYYCYTLKNAIKKHRAIFNLRGKHFEKIYI